MFFTGLQSRANVDRCQIVDYPVPIA